MKKHAIKLSLAFMPFLLAGSTIVNAENTQATSESTTEISNIEETVVKDSVNPEAAKKETTQTTENSAPKKEAKALEVTTKSLSGSKGQIKLAKIGTVEPIAEFKDPQNEFIKVEKDGTWTALKDGKTTFVLEYELSKESLDAIQKENPDYLVEKTGKTEEISADVTKEAKEKADISLEIVGGQLTAVEGNKDNGKALKVQVKGGEAVTGTFKAIDSKSFVLDKDGNYSIPKEARYEKLNQKVEFTLDDASHDKLAALSENKDKTVERTYEMDVTKKAQKDIQLRFKNKGINTVVGGQGRILLEDTIIDSESKKEIKLIGIENAKFKELKDNEFLTIDELGNWKALKAGKGPLTPAVVLADTTIEALEKEFNEFDINITSETLEVTISQTGTGSGSNGKTYEPVKNLPQTGEQKMKFAGAIGAIIIALAGVIFYFKKKKTN